MAQLPRSSACYSITVTGLFLLLGLALLGPCQRRGTAREPDKATPKWEYCSIVASPLKYDWVKADGVVHSDSWRDLAEKMDVKIKEKNPDKRSIQMAIFDRLGSQGWELVSHAVMEKGGSYEQVSLFKRRVQ